MKLSLKFRSLALGSIALFTVILFSQCKEDVKKPGDEKDCCKGYTGKLTNPRAEKLRDRCHFITEDSIDSWTDRYKAYKASHYDSLSTINSSDPAFKFLNGSSISFNHCIIKSILCNENCIGLRVLYGMSADKKIHIIIVGIKPDYNNLYVDEPKECCPNKSSSLENLTDGITGLTGSTQGGAEYGQMP